MSSITKSKLVVKDLGNPKAVLSKDESDRSLHVLGTIAGIARAVKTKVDAKGDTFEGIVGEFEGARAEDGEIIESGILYLPSGIHERIAEPLKADDAPPIEFGIEIAVRRATNAAGYEYIVTPLYKTQSADPLAKIREAMAAAKQAALPKPEATEHKNEKSKAKA